MLSLLLVRARGKFRNENKQRKKRLFFLVLVRACNSVKTSAPTPGSSAAAPRATGRAQTPGHGRGAEFRPRGGGGSHAPDIRATRARWRPLPPNFFLAASDPPPGWPQRQLQNVGRTSRPPFVEKNLLKSIC